MEQPSPQSLHESGLPFLWLQYTEFHNMSCCCSFNAGCCHQHSYPSCPGNSILLSLPLSHARGMDPPQFLIFALITPNSKQWIYFYFLSCTFPYFSIMYNRWLLRGEMCLRKEFIIFRQYSLLFANIFYQKSIKFQLRHTRPLYIGLVN